MKNILLTVALVMTVTPAFSKDYIIKEVTDENAKKQNFFSPDKLTIQPSDSVTFENAQDSLHEVMFISQPKAVDEMIMSSMHEKAGDKFTYKFTVPGTYKFHCHPHEKLGMEGVLIVGKASGSGETKIMDHHKLAKNLEAGEGAAAGEIAATGHVIGVDADKRTIKIRHDPIKSLNWPAMIMNFTVDSSVDISSAKEGDIVSFMLKPQGKDDYKITSISKN